MEVSDEVAMAIVPLPSPLDPTFTSRSKNPIREIEEAVLSVNHSPIKWEFKVSASPSRTRPYVFNIHFCESYPPFS